MDTRRRPLFKWPQPLEMIWLSLIVSYGWILLLVLLQQYKPDADSQPLHNRWHISEEEHLSAGRIGASACGAFFLVFAFASGFSRGVKWALVFATCLYCGLVLLSFILDGMHLLYHPYGLELQFYGLHVTSAVVIYFLVGTVISMLHGAERANFILREPALVFMVGWSLLWPTARFLTKLWNEPQAVIVAIILDCLYLAISLFGGLSAVRPIKGLLKLHWTVLIAGFARWIAQVTGEVLNLMIAARYNVPAVAGFGSLQAFILCEVLAISVFVLSAIMTYEESWRFEAERDAAHAELKMRIQQQEEAQKAEQARQKFLRYIFHEIRVPFNSLDMGLGMIMDDISTAEEEEQLLMDVEEKRALVEAGAPTPIPDRLVLPGDARATLDIMAKAAASMKVIINDTLDWTKLQSGAFQISLGASRLTDLVSGTVVGLSTFAMHPDNKVKLVQQIDPRLPTWLVADKVRLQQVVANFLSNAIKFAPHDGTGVVTVRIQVIDGGNAWKARTQGTDADPPAFDGQNIWWKDATATVEPTLSLNSSSSQRAVQAAVQSGAVDTARISAREPAITSSKSPGAAAVLPHHPRAPSFRQSMAGEGLAVSSMAAPTVVSATRGQTTARTDTVPHLASPPHLATGSQANKRSWLPRMFSGTRSGRDSAGTTDFTSEAGRGGSVTPSPHVSKQSSTQRSQTLLPLSLRPPMLTPELRTKLRQDGFSFKPVLGDAADGSAVFSGSAISYLEMERDKGPSDTADQYCTVVIGVQDNGDGVAPADIPTLFRAFKQLDAGMQYKGKGTGLGLAICHEIVSQHGGRVGVRSSGKKGEGAEFMVALRLPVLQRSGPLSARAGAGRDSSMGRSDTTPSDGNESARSRTASAMSYGPATSRDISAALHSARSDSVGIGEKARPLSGTSVRSVPQPVGGYVPAFHPGRPVLMHGTMSANSGGPASDVLLAYSPGPLGPASLHGRPVSSPQEPYTSGNTQPSPVSEHRTRGVHEQMMRRAAAAAAITADAINDPHSGVMPVQHGLHGSLQVGIRLSTPGSPQGIAHGAVGLPGQVFVPLCGCGEPLTPAGVCSRCSVPGNLVTVSPPPAARTQSRSVKLTQGDVDKILTPDSIPGILKRPNSLYQARGGSVNSGGSTGSAGPMISSSTRPPLLGVGPRHGSSMGSAGRPYIPPLPIMLPPLPIMLPPVSGDPTAASSSASSLAEPGNATLAPSLQQNALPVDIVSIPVMPPMGDHPREPSGWSGASGRSSEDGEGNTRLHIDAPGHLELNAYAGAQSGASGLSTIEEGYTPVQGQHHDVPNSHRKPPRLRSPASAEPLTATPGLLRILVVDDVGDSRKLLNRALRRKIEHILAKEAPKSGCSIPLIEVDEAEDGHIAVEMITGRTVENLSSQECPSCSLGDATDRPPKRYDVITMDAEMPILSGFRATELLRSAGYTGLLYGCTGNALEEDQQLFKRCGANDVFIKPLDTQGLAHAVIKGLKLAKLTPP